MDERKPGQFTDPQDFEDCLARMDSLLDAIRDIQAEFGNKNRTDSDGKRLSSHKYHEWKTRAQKALRYKEKEYAYLKRWKINHLRKQQEQLITAEDEVSLISRAAECIRRNMAECQFTEQDKELLEKLQAFCKSRNLPL